MPSYLYGLVPDADRARMPEDLRGLGDAPVRVVSCGALGAIVGDVARAPTPRLDDVRCHDRVLRVAVEAGCTVIASRFGQAFHDDQELCREVSAHGAAAARTLAAHQGCVEMRILVAGAAGPAATAASPIVSDHESPGRAYLERLRQQHTERPLAFSVRAGIGATVRAERVEALPGDAGLAVVHLVARPDLPAWRDAVARLPALATSRVVGPLPLYSFAEPLPGGPGE